MKNAQLRNKVILILFICLTISSYANDFYSEIIKDKKYYFNLDIDINNDGILDKIISSKPYHGDELYFFVKKDNDYELAYKGKNFSEDGGNIIKGIKEFKINNNTSLNIQTFFPDRGYLVFNYIIKYKNSTWYLDKVIYEIGYPFDYDERIDTCIIKENKPLSDINNGKVNIKGVPLENVRDELCNISFNIKSTLTQFINRIKIDSKDKYLTKQRYLSLLNKYPLNIKTLTQYNNIAYYLQKAKANKEAIFLFKKILEKYPSRTVAHYNIADAYWDIDDKKNAIKHYNIYIKQMKEKGKEKRIPKKVLQRVSKELKVNLN